MQDGGTIVLPLESADVQHEVEVVLPYLRESVLSVVMSRAPLLRILPQKSQSKARW